MSSLLQRIEDRLKELILPLLGEGEDDPIRELGVAPFQNTDDIEAMLGVYKTRLPAAWLNTPTINYPEKPARIVEVGLDYGLLVALDDRTGFEQRKAWAYGLHDRLMNTLFFREMSILGGAASLDHIMPTGFQYADMDGGLGGVLLVQFRVTVRNWQIAQH